MVVRGSRQETLDSSFVLLGTPNSCSSLNSYDYTNPIQYRNQQNKQFHSMFRQKNKKIICNLLPDQWSFTNNNTNLNNTLATISNQ
ncbi:unnamed protein product [Schistosoma margrebowiei]|uniref:Uncharacterized protein n=1 Tax=Schistosoma margrebowiei TaxID=48269 RepID=A0A183LED2_9TREM|nr:unnamed protein product [Schistosoma margrebowiei]